MKTYPYNEPVREKVFHRTRLFINELNKWLELENSEGNLITIIGCSVARLSDTFLYSFILYTSKKVVESQAVEEEKSNWNNDDVEDIEEATDALIYG